jgi:RNA polymerase sigma-70 factor (TIGR02943 family)
VRGTRCAITLRGPCFRRILSDSEGHERETKPHGPCMTEADQSRASVESAASAAGAGAVLEPENWVEKHGDVLFGFAVARVPGRAIAQDLVQETFLAALKARGSFTGRSTERAWLFGILRNKLADYYRRQSREVPIADLEAPLPEEQESFNSSGAGADGWARGRAPRAWENPEATLVSKEFQEVLKRCASRLPHKTAEAFLRREMDGTPSEEICKDLGISPNNLWVMLHRARMSLRRCLEEHWFEQKHQKNENET